MKENILIICYSYSGKTRGIAEMIEKQTGGIRSQIYPRQPRSDGRSEPGITRLCFL